MYLTSYNILVTVTPYLLKLSIANDLTMTPCILKLSITDEVTVMPYTLEKMYVPQNMEKLSV